MIDLRNYPKKLLWRLYLVSLVVIVILDFYFLYTDVFHFHFDFQQIPQFFALLGLFGCMLLILIAKCMGYFIVADEDYYHKKEEERH